MRFAKLHGCGNAYVYVDGRRTRVVAPRDLAVRVSDPVRGIGSDGLIVVHPSACADVRMEMYNADGSRGAMCGNGVRCLGRFVLEDDPQIGGVWREPAPPGELLRSLDGADAGSGEQFLCAALAGALRAFLLDEQREMLVRTLTVETDAGLKTIYGFSVGGQVPVLTVDVGPISFAPSGGRCTLPGEQIVDREVAVGGRRFRLTCVDVGSYHAVVFVDDVDKVPLDRDGPLLEHAPFFPDRANIQFAQVVTRNVLRLRSWERGSGATLACGTGACAVVAAALATGRAESVCRVEQPGGAVLIYHGPTVLLSGPAEFACRGTFRDGIVEWD